MFSPIRDLFDYPIENQALNFFWLFSPSNNNKYILLYLLFAVTWEEAWVLCDIWYIFWWKKLGHFGQFKNVPFQHLKFRLKTDEVFCKTCRCHINRSQTNSREIGGILSFVLNTLFPSCLIIKTRLSRGYRRGSGMLSLYMYNKPCWLKRTLSKHQTSQKTIEFLLQVFVSRLETRCWLWVS